MKIQSLSVFLPAYNEEKNIEKTIDNVVVSLRQVAKTYEIIVIDDGSTDATVQVIERLKKKTPKLRLIKHKRNQGYGAAIITGLKAAQYPWVAYIDSDGQFDFSEIKKFLKLKDSNDLVIGYRLKRSDNFYRQVLQKILRLVGLVLFAINIKDVDCGFKLIRKRAIEKIFPLTTKSAITETEMIVRAHRAGFRIAQVGVNHHLRLEGEQTGGKLKIVWRAAREGLKLWWQLLDKTQTFILLAILLLATALRLYRLRDYLIFLGDEGRDVLVVKRMLVDHKFTLLGPTASVGGFYLGPVYYYFMLPFLWLSRFDPVGPAFMVALFGIATVGLVYLVGKRVNRTTGLLAAFFYAINPLVVHYSRSSWNPNLVPFFSLMIVYLLSRGIESKKPNYWFWVGICLGVIWQLHYLALIVLPLVIISTLGLTKPRIWLKAAFYCLLGSLISFSPYIAFELRHGFPNTKTIFEFITRQDGSVGFEAKRFLQIFFKNGQWFFKELFFVKTWSVLNLMLMVVFVTAISIRKKLPLITNWLILGLLSLAFYRGSVHNYYFSFLFPIVIITVAVGLVWLWQKNRLLKILSLGLVLFLANNFYQNLYFHERPSKLISQTQEMASLILDRTGGKEFNFALITDRNSDHAYRYFLEIWDQSPLGLEEKVTEQLIVLCESKDCNPLGHPLWEIAGFGRAEITDSWVVGPEFKLFHLIHHSDSLDLINKPAVKGV